MKVKVVYTCHDGLPVADQKQTIFYVKGYYQVLSTSFSDLVKMLEICEQITIQESEKAGYRIFGNHYNAMEYAKTFEKK